MKNLCRQILEKHNFKIKTIKKLNAGASSVIYLAETTKGQMVVKVRIYEGGRLEKEYNILKALEKMRLKPELTPKVYAYGIMEGKQYLIEEYIIGKRLPWYGLKDNDVRLVAKFLKRIHSIKLNKELKKIPIDNASPLEKLDYAKLGRHLNKQFSNLLKKSEIIIGQIKIKPEFKLRHSDLNPKNFIVNKKHLIIVDWEECKIGQPAIDIADFFVKGDLTKKQKNIFYYIYGSDNNINFKKTVELYSLISLSIIKFHLERIDNIKKHKLDIRLYESLEIEQQRANHFTKLVQKMIDNSIN